MIANVLSIAGSDPSGGAGIQADIKAISANGGYAMAAVTALTVQNTQGVMAVHPVAADVVGAQIRAILADVRVDAIKIGMLANAEIAAVVADCLVDLPVPIVVDTVLASTGGVDLLAGTATGVFVERIIPLAAVITPNLPEAAALLGGQEADTRQQMEAQAKALVALGADHVLLKGGHLPGAQCPDVLVSAQAVHWQDTPRIESTKTHGTGCTLSSALATRLGAGNDPDAAFVAAKAYTLGAIRSANNLDVGRGTGPTDHFHAFARG